MKILITKSQYASLISESKYSTIKEALIKNKKISDKILAEVSENTKINLTMLSTWGAGVAGFIGPLNSFVTSAEFNISKQDASLIVCAVSAIIYNSRRAEAKKLVELVKERGLEAEYQETLDAAKELKRSFINLIKSLNVAALETSKIISYTFLIPIIPLLLEITTNSAGTPKQIASRVFASIVSLGVGQITKEILTILIGRFKNNS